MAEPLLPKLRAYFNTSKGLRQSHQTVFKYEVEQTFFLNNMRTISLLERKEALYE